MYAFQIHLWPGKSTGRLLIQFATAVKNPILFQSHIHIECSVIFYFNQQSKSEKKELSLSSIYL